MHTGQRWGVRAAAAVAVLLQALNGCAVATSASDPRAPRPETSPTTSTRTHAPTEAPPTEAVPTEAVPTEASPTEPSSEGAERVADVLARLPVKGRAPMTGYDRDRFGQAWLDADRNGCDTRNDVLGATLSPVEVRDGTHGCVVESGELADPYTATTISYVYGDGFLVDIDHVVALGNAWVTGAFALDIRTRAALANDPLNLLAVDAGENRSKGDGDAATWLPPNKGYRCEYVARQVAVKDKYELWVTAPEAEAVARVIASCPDQPVPLDSGAPVEVDQDITDPGVPTTEPAPGGVHYASCDDARADGAAPVHVGDPGYGAHLDGDGDGSACE